MRFHDYVLMQGTHVPQELAVEKKPVCLRLLCKRRSNRLGPLASCLRQLQAGPGFF